MLSTSVGAARKRLYNLAAGDDAFGDKKHYDNSDIRKSICQFKGLLPVQERRKDAFIIVELQTSEM